MTRVLTTVLSMLLLAATPSAQGPTYLGEWDLTTLSPMGENTNTMELKQDAEGLKAVAKGAQGERPYDSVLVDGDKLTLVMTIDFQGQPMTITYMGTIADNQINGSADFGGLAQGSFSAKKKEAAR